MCRLGARWICHAQCYFGQWIFIERLSVGTRVTQWHGNAWCSYADWIIVAIHVSYNQFGSMKRSDLLDQGWAFRSVWKFVRIEEGRLSRKDSDVYTSWLTVFTIDRRFLTDIWLLWIFHGFLWNSVWNV